MLTITSEYISYEDHFERKPQANISPFDQSFEKQEEQLIEFKEKHHDELIKFSSRPIQNKVLTLTPKHPPSTYHFESIFQANISSSDQSPKKNMNN